MTDSANFGRRLRRQMEITRAAQRLARRDGLDGFTMEQLADEVGVSRRTLFNHVDSKLDAVLGPSVGFDPELLDRFAAGGPTGRLIGDLRQLVHDAIDVDEDLLDADEAVAVRELIQSDPRLYSGAQTRMTSAVEDLVEVIVEREGGVVDAFRARVLVRLLVTQLELSLDIWLDEPATPLSTHFAAVADATAAAYRSR